MHLKLKFNFDIKPIYDVIVTIPGTTYPDEWIIRGNHHDGWVNGAEDPISGASALMEEVRALGLLLKQGWKPKRTIIYCLWDGEEPGLLGSTEWAETHADELAAKAAVYINSDSNGRGRVERGRLSHAREIYQRRGARYRRPRSQDFRLEADASLSHCQSGRPPRRQEARNRPDLRIGALGSGSDYTAFLDHIGIASLDLGFGGEDGGGIYHSVYDDFYWYTHFGDTNFVYGRALAQTAGTAVLRLADAELLPFDFDNLTDTIRRYIDEVERLARDKRDQIIERNREIDDGVFAAIDDPRHKKIPPAKEPVPPFLNFAPLENGFAALQRASELYDHALAHVSENGGSALARANLRDANLRLVQVERSLTLKEGLPNRPWFKHQIYAPGFYTGYGVKTLPAVRESIEQKDWKLVDEETVKVGKVLENAGEAIQGAAAELSRAGQ